MTCQHGDALELEVALLAAELEQHERLVELGIAVPGRRAPSTPEVRSGVRFARLDDLVTQAGEDVAAEAARVRAATADAIAEALGEQLATADPHDAVRILADLADPTSGRVLPGMAAVVDDAHTAIRDRLTGTLTESALEVAEEGRRQGLPDALIPDAATLVDVPPSAYAAADAHARRVATQPVERALAVALEAAQRAATLPDATGTDVLLAALDAVDQASTAGTEDVARQAANVAHGLARTHALRVMPPPREVYASELLDSNTCLACSAVDGRTYDSLESALVDYPGAGGYVGCAGGSRCRGTLVVVHDTEAAPTLDTPGDGRTPPAHTPDRTPRGPSMPDVGVPAPSDVIALEVTSAGTVVMPEPAGMPLPTPAPDAAATAPADPSLDDLTDDELEARFLAAAEAGDADAAARFGDELDRRTATAPAPQVDAWGFEIDPNPPADRFDEYGFRIDDVDDVEQYAALAADDAAAFGALTGLTPARTAGRRIDAVRAEWDLWVESTALEALEASRGTLLRRDRYEAFRAKYGAGAEEVLFTGPARVAYYYASEELRDYWARKPRLTFAEFAVQSGITDAKMTARARKAAEARREAMLRAEEDPAKRAQRKREQDAERRRRRGPDTAGQQLDRAQRRIAAERKREARLQRELGGE